MAIGNIALRCFMLDNECFRVLLLADKSNHSCLEKSVLYTILVITNTAAYRYLKPKRLDADTGRSIPTRHNNFSTHNSDELLLKMFEANYY